MAVPAASIVISGLPLLVELFRAKAHHQRELAIAQLQAGVLHDLVDAVVHKRIDAIRLGFEGVLAQYGEQAAHFVRQHDRYIEEELGCTDPIRRLELQSRIRAVDQELQCIRIDARLVYARMLDALNQMGGPLQGFAAHVVAPLALPMDGGSFGRER